MKLHPIAIAPGLAADAADFRFVGEASKTLQRFTQNVLLLHKLEFVAGVLQVAAAACAEIFATGRDRSGAGVYNFTKQSRAADRFSPAEVLSETFSPGRTKGVRMT